MKKIMTIFGAFLFASLVFTSCGSEDAKKNGEKAGKCDCKEIKLDIEKYELRMEQLKTFDDDGEIDDREEYAELQLDIFDLEQKEQELELEVYSYRMQGYAGENFHDEDRFEYWMEDFDDARKRYVEDNCEDEQEDLEKLRERYWEKEQKKRGKDEKDYR